MKKKAKIIIFIVLIIGLGTYMYFEATKPLKLETVELGRKDIVSDFKESAKLVSNDVVSFTPSFAGELVFIVESGTKVKAGDLLFSISTDKLESKRSELIARLNSLSGQEEMSKPSNFSSQLKSADIAIDNARNILERAEKDLLKYKNLYEAGVIAKSEFEIYQRGLDDAKDNLKARKNERQIILEQSSMRSGSKEFYGGQKEAITVLLDEIEDNLSRKDVYAKEDGIVSMVFAKEGDLTNPAMPLLQFNKTSDMLAMSEIISSDAMALKLGQEVEIIQKIGQDNFREKGEIVYIAANATSKISTLGLEEQRVLVKVASDSFSDLILGADMDIVFETMHLSDKLAIEKELVFKDDGQYYVWFVNDGILEKRKIEIGKDSGYEYEVLSGLEEGDIVVRDINNKDLEDGKKLVSIDK